MKKEITTNFYPFRGKGISKYRFISNESEPIKYPIKYSQRVNKEFKLLNLNPLDIFFIIKIFNKFTRFTTYRFYV
jgi:hypothetical protein